MKVKLKIKIDRNGNKALNVKVDAKRAFNIQTNGNLTKTHTVNNKSFIHMETIEELLFYLSEHGNKTQKAVFELDKPFDIYDFCPSSFKCWEEDRKRQQSNFEKSILNNYDIDYIVRHVEFLMDGDMGYHGRIIAQNIMKMSKRANKNAALVQNTLSCLGVPNYYRKQWYKKLSEEQQTELNAKIDDLREEFTSQCYEILVYNVKEKIVLI